MNVFDHADNLPLGRMSPLVIGDPLADRVFAWKILPGQRLIDYGHSGPGSILSFGEKPSAHQIRLEGGQIFRAHMALDNLIAFVMARSSRDLDRVDIAVALHRKQAGHAGRLNPW